MTANLIGIFFPSLFLPLQMRDSIGQQPISRSGSARSFNTTFGRPVATPSPRTARANQPGAAGPQSLGPQMSTPQQKQQQEFLRQQAEYRRQQQEQQGRREQGFNCRDKLRQ